MSDILSPCINVCVMDASTQICRGCGRNIDEIAHWTRYSTAERERIMALLPERLQKFQASSRSGPTGLTHP